MKKIFFYICIILTFGACKSKKVVSNDGIDFSLKSHQILKKHQEAFNDYKTLTSSALVKVNIANNQQNLSLSYRSKKGEAIWLSAPLGIAKVLLSKEEISFYNKLNKTYLKGNYKIVKDFLGIDLDYFSIENLISGNIFLNVGEWNLFPSKDGYVAEKEKNGNKIKILLTSFFKLEYLFFEKENLSFIVKYEYQFVENQYFTKKVNVEANLKGNKIHWKFSLMIFL